MFDGINISRVAFEIPLPQFLQNWFPSLGASLAIYWYGIIIVIGIALGAWWAARELQKRQLGVKAIDEFYNGLIIVVIAGYLFARLTYVVLDIMDGAQYSSFGQVFNFRAGGVNILGGFVGAVLVAWFYIVWRHLKFWHYADVAGPALLLAQAIGRWGNFINKELYGPPTGSSSWGLLIDAPYRISKYADLTVYPPETRFHPTFLYESIALFVGFLLLVWLNGRYRDQWEPGTLFGLFLLWWGGNRTWIEFFRPDQTTIGNSFLTYSMVVAFGIALFGLWLTLKKMNRLPEALATKRKRPVKPKPRRN
ncbi:MAG: prolipoprotein diacylglyceryl transferase [Anaerolineales bacterium]|nr:prolipoprotein diacylglyceryl transferase [Anaerolineales bacterium]